MTLSVAQGSYSRQSKQVNSFIAMDLDIWWIVQQCNVINILVRISSPLHFVLCSLRENKFSFDVLPCVCECVFFFFFKLLLIFFRFCCGHGSTKSAHSTQTYTSSSSSSSVSIVRSIELFGFYCSHSYI